MKALTKTLIAGIIALFCFSACEKTPDGPPLTPPSYEGPKANMTIAELKTKYAHLSTWGDSELVEYEYVIKAVVIANDESGNIYKQIYVRDETGAINIGVDEGSASSYYRVGQTVYINLHGLAMVNYANQLQIGAMNTASNRIPWMTFQEQVVRDGLPDASKAQPIVLSMGQISQQYVNNLVRFNTVYFLEGGKNTFADANDAGNRTISDGASTAVVRTTTYSNFAYETLPEGSGDIIVVLGYYNNGYQLLLRNTDDLINFGGPIPGDPGPGPGPDPGDGEVIFEETFGTGSYLSGNRPLISAFTDFDMKSPVVYSDATGRTDIRSTGTMNAHAWFPTQTGSGTDASLTISGINTSGYSDLVLTFELATGLSADAVSETNLNVMQLKVDGVSIPLKSTPVSVANNDNNKFYEFTVDNIPAKDNLTIEFFTDATNISGIRLDNIKITADGEGGGTTPPPTGSETEFFKETFGSGSYLSGNRPLISAFTDFDMKSPVAYSDATGRTDIRSTGTMNAHAWFPTVTGSGTDASLKISGINTSGYSDITLTFELATGLSADAVTATNLNIMQLKVDGVTKTLDSTPVSADKGDNNKFYKFTVTGIPSKDNLLIEFFTDTTNISGFRLDNIILSGKAN